ncbi:SpoIIE family protein phosphatase [Kitasatospora sp. NPDC054939]
MDDRRLPFPDGVAGLLVDGGGRVVGCTPAAEELLGVPAGALCGRAAHELLPGAESVAASGGVTVRGADGRETPLDVRVLTLRGADAHDPQSPRRLLLAVPSATAARQRQDEAFTRELFLQNRVGLAVFDENLRLSRTNTHLLPYTGLPGELKGARLGDFLMAQDAAAVEARLRVVLDTGQPLVFAEELVRTQVNPRGGRVLAISAFRLLGDGGAVIGVTALFTDVTEQHRAQERLALLHRVTAAMGGTLAAKSVAQELARALAQHFADSAAVDVAATVLAGDEPPADGDWPAPLHRTAVVGAVAAEGIPGDSWVMTVPLRSRGLPLGRITVRREAGRDEFDAQDRALLAEIADRAALALDNAYRYTREHRVAVALQRSLLPPAERSITAVGTASVYLPADRGGVGGDWFDVVPLSSTRVALVVGDVAGHGLHASASMGRMRTAVRTLADLDLEPDELLAHLDDLVAQLLAEAEFTDGGGPGVPNGHPGAGAFGGTCLYVVYDPVARTCVAASAGHPPPAVTRPDGTSAYLPVVPGPPLGVGGHPFEAVETVLEPGSVLALYTDGLIERGEGDIDEGMAELLRRLVHVGDPAQPLREAGRRITAGLPPTRLRDDVTLLLARTRAVSPDDLASWTIDPDPRVVARVRADATAQLTAWGLAELAFTTELILSELVTNAIRYAGGPVTMRMIRAATLICEVSDGSSTQPRMRRARLTDEGGRGLYLVAQLAARWGSRYTARGKTIWTEQPFPGL